jgi:predicted DNA-binding transcriptional regulator AlpA
MSQQNDFPELINAEQVGKLLGVSKWCIFKYDRARQIPAAVHFAGRKCWRYREIRDWISSGCPQRDDWRWEPAEWQTLEDRVRSKRHELAELQRRIEAANQQLDELEAKATTK